MWTETALYEGFFSVIGRIKKKVDRQYVVKSQCETDRWVRRVKFLAERYDAVIFYFNLDAIMCPSRHRDEINCTGTIWISIVRRCAPRWVESEIDLAGFGLDLELNSKMSLCILLCTLVMVLACVFPRTVLYKYRRNTCNFNRCLLRVLIQTVPLSRCLSTVLSLRTIQYLGWF